MFLQGLKSGRHFTLPGTAGTRIKSRNIRKISRATGKLSTTSEETVESIRKGTRKPARSAQDWVTFLKPVWPQPRRISQENR